MMISSMQKSTDPWRFGLYSKADQCQGNVRSSSESQRQNGYRAGRKAEHPEASKTVSGKSADHKGKFPEPAGTWKYQGKKHFRKKKKTGLIRMGEYKYWATALAQIYQIEQKDHGETMDSQLASIYIRNLIRNSISDDIYYEAFYNPLGECILFGMNEPEEMEKILLKLNDIAKESKRVMKIKAAIGVGKIKDELIKVKESFEEAKEALSYRKMSQDGDVIYMEDIDKSEQVLLLFDEKAQDKLFTAVKFGKEEDIHAVIRKMKEYLIKADMSSSSYQAYSMSVINALLVFARQQDLEIEEVFDGIPNYLEIMQKYASADTFMEWLEEQCIRLNASQGRERENKAKGIIEEAKQKIQEEFGDPDIGLEKIAAEVGLTQTYFSSLFKKETGMSFVEYLTDTRMKEAMRLLKETSEKIYVVAQKVGYLESGYFSHVFKKKIWNVPDSVPQTGAIDGRLYVGENQTQLSEVSAETEYAEYSVCDHSDADAACRCLCRIFCLQVSAGKAGTDHHSG